MKNVTPDAIMQLAFGYWGSKTLLSAVEIGLFTELAKRPLSLEECRSTFGLHERGARDFLDALVALGMLQREQGKYSNTPATDLQPDLREVDVLGEAVPIGHRVIAVGMRRRADEVLAP